jgi:hypothetical protein
MDETPRFLGTPASIRITAAILLVVLIVVAPFALMFAGLSVMATDAGPSTEAMTFIAIVWGGVLLLFVAGLLALIALIVPRRGLILTALVLTLPSLLAVGLLIGAISLS